MRLYANDLDSQSLAKYESTHFLGNGYLGVRSCFEEGYGTEYWTNQRTMINGFYDIHDIEYGEKAFAFPEVNETIVPVIDGQSTKIYVDGEEFSVFHSNVTSYERYVDLELGIHVRKVKFLTKLGKEIDIIFNRLVSFKYQELFFTRIEINCESNCHIKLVTTFNYGHSFKGSAFDPRVGQHQILPKDFTVNKDAEMITVKTLRSDLINALVYQFNDEYTLNINKNSCEITSEFYANQINFDKKLLYFDSRFNTLEDIKVIKYKHKKLSYEYYLSEQKASVKQLFHRLSEVEIAPEYKEVTYHNLFSIYQSIGQRKELNISAKGLSGLGYEGHYFWDSEIYVFPVMLKLNPGLARNMIEYRYTLIEHAKRRALELGYMRGALFPWRTITGRECSAFFEAGTAQHHITGDIAYTVIQYFEETRDIDFLIEKGMEMLYECALLWLEIGFFDDSGAFHIDMVTGPDEYSALVCDNYYTNTLAKYNMSKFLEYFELLKEKIPFINQISTDDLEKMHGAIEHMAVYVDEKSGVTSQDRDFLNKKVLDFKSLPADKFPLLLNYHPLFIYRHQVCKQADVVLAHYMFDKNLSYDQIQRDVEYYDRITTHDSSLSYSIYAIMYKRLGQFEKADEYIRKNLYLDLEDIHHNAKDGVHIAAMAGSLLYLLDTVTYK